MMIVGLMSCEGVKPMRAEKNNQSGKGTSRRTIAKIKAEPKQF